MKIIALNGLLGYGYSEESLTAAFEESPDYVGVDGGSTDPGPYYLGSGKSFTDRAAVKRDAALALPLALKCKAPFIVGTSGGSGSKVHLNWLKEIFLEIAKEQQLTFKMALIYTDVTTQYVIEKLRDGKIIPMGPQLKLTEEAIQGSVRIVSQIGAQPIMEALQNDADVILAGRACDTAIYAAPCLLRGYDPGLSFHMAKIMECGAMCAQPVAAADVMQGRMEKTFFELTPASSHRKCTVERVAAHTMYEQVNPYLIYEPDGVVDLKQSQYKQINERTVRVWGSKFTQAKEKTLKIEGARVVGFRTISICSIKDPETSRRIDEIFEGVCTFVTETLKKQVSSEDYSIRLRKYGMPLIPEEAPDIPTTDVGLILDVVGKNQEISDMVCALIRARMLHFDYEGRKTTAGNLAFPYSPSDMHVGVVYAFSIYHLAKVDSLSETSEICYEEVKGDQSWNG